MKRCDAPAHLHSKNGMRLCTQCAMREMEKHDDLMLFDDGSVAKCDRPVDGMGAASWSKRKHLHLEENDA